MRSAAARRTTIAYGGLAKDIPDEVTAAWTQPFLEDAGVRRDTAAFLRGVDKSITLDAAARLPSLRIPALIASRQGDRVCSPELGRRLAEVSATARLEPIAGARTFVAEDAPEALADLIRGFVREAAPQAA